MEMWYLAIPVVLGVLAYSVYLNRRNRRTLERQQADFRSRPVREQAAWFNEEFAGLGLSQDRVASLLAPVAQKMDCDITQLSASDSFDGSLQWRGKTFLGIDDDNPWDDYVEQTLPEVCGSHEKAMDVVQRIEGNPTLAELIKAVADVPPTPPRS